MSVQPNILREIGRIVRPHGVVGELKVAPETDDPDRFFDLTTVFIGQNDKTVSIFTIESVRTQTSRHGITVLLTLAGISDRASADELKSLSVFVRESDLPPLEEGEYYISNLIGLIVVSDDGSTIGTIKDVLDLPAQKMLLVEDEAGKEVMIPSVPEFVKDIDFELRRMVVSVIEGML